MKMKFYGVRGSYPTPDARMMGYGGKTASVAFFNENSRGKTIPLFIDAGNGIVTAGQELIKGLFDGSVNTTFPILFTHLHPDHTEGFTFFTPNFLPQVTLYLLGMETLKKNVGAVLKQKMLPPTYPIEYRDLKSYRNHGVLSDGQRIAITADGIPIPYTDAAAKANKDEIVYIIDVMQSFAPSHPQQGALYFRVTDTKTSKSVACIWDIESHTGGDMRVINFAKGCDYMIHDTQYTDEEYYSSKMIVQGFGHSTYNMAIENAAKAGVGTLIPFHYNPNHTDEKLNEILNNFKNKSVLQFMAKEGLTIEI